MTKRRRKAPVGRPHVVKPFSVGMADDDKALLVAMADKEGVSVSELNRKSNRFYARAYHPELFEGRTTVNKYDAADMKRKVHDVWCALKGAMAVCEDAKEGKK